MASVNSKLQYLAGLSAAVLAFTLNANQNAHAQDAQLIPAASPDDIVVTGTRAAGRTVENSVAPIDVVTGESIELANKANVLEQLQTNLPSFFVPNVGTPNIGSMVRAGQLRGQNPGHTLVLVNGKRRHSTSFLGAGGFTATAPVDLSLISSGAIKRVEVLRDGASAIYGSDAIAGVINIITDDSAEGGNVSARYGQYFEGDGETTVLQASQGFKIGDGGHLRLSAQYDDQEIVIRNSPVNPALLYYFPISTITGQPVTPAGTLNTNPTLPANAVRNPREATRDNNAWKNQGKAPFTLNSYTADFSLPIGAGAEVYSFATYARRDSAAPQNFRTPNRDENVRAIYPDGFTPVEEIDETDYSGLVGVRGTDLAGWDWDLSSVYGRNSIDIYVTNSINATYGLASQTDFYIGNNDYWAWTSNFDLRRRFDLLSIPTDVSVGVEYRKENFELSAGDVQGYTNGGQRVLDGPRAGTVLGNSIGVSQALPAYSPADAQEVDRDAISLYAGLALKPTEAWSVDLAVRGEDFSDFGSQITYRASSRYDFGDNFAVRGTYSTGFHAPALAALSFRSTGNANTSTNYTLAVGSPEALALGSKPLEPETSVNYSAGFVARPFWDVGIAVDAYQIEIENRITQISNFNTAARPLGPTTGTPSLSQQLTNGRILRGDGISYFVNSSDTRTKGVEITIDKKFDFDDWGTFGLSYAANFNNLKLTKIYSASPILAQYGITLLSASDGINLKNSVPNQRHVINADWSKGPFSVGVRQSYYGSLKRSGTVNVPPTTGPFAGITQFDYDIGGLWTTDVNLGWNVNEKVRLSVNGNNIFEALPTRTPEPLLAFQQLYAYGNNGAIGAEGGFWSAKVDYRW